MTQWFVHNQEQMNLHTFTRHRHLQRVSWGVVSFATLSCSKQIAQRDGSYLYQWQGDKYIHYLIIISSSSLSISSLLSCLIFIEVINYSIDCPITLKRNWHELDDSALGNTPWPINWYTCSTIKVRTDEGGQVRGVPPGLH